MSFYGFTPNDFDAYLPRKWQSNVFNRERLVVKEKLDAIGRELAPVLIDAGGAPLLHEVSVEHPAIWNQRTVSCQFLFFARNAEARRMLDGIIASRRTIASLVDDPSPLRNHIFLGLKIDQHGLDLGLYLHSDAVVDRENLEHKLDDFFDREKVLHAIHALGADYAVGLSATDSAALDDTPAPELDEAALKQLVARLATAHTWLQAVRRIPRDDVILASPTFGEDLAAAFRSQLPLLNAIAWSRGNDHVSMRETLKKEDKKRLTKGLGKNDRVRITSGMLAGKTGIVQEAGAKGEVKVLVGTLILKVRSDALAKVE